MGIKTYLYIGGACIVIGGGLTILGQNKTISNLNEDKGALNEQISSLQGQLNLAGTERTRISDELATYKDKKAEVEIRYLTKKIPIYKEIVKTVPEQIVTVDSNKDFNETLNGISSSALAFYSVRNSIKTEAVPASIPSLATRETCPTKP